MSSLAACFRSAAAFLKLYLFFFWLYWCTSRRFPFQKTRPKTKPFIQRGEAPYRKQEAQRRPYGQPDSPSGHNATAVRRPFQLRRRWEHLSQTRKIPLEDFNVKWAKWNEDSCEWDGWCGLLCMQHRTQGSRISILFCRGTRAGQCRQSSRLGGKRARRYFFFTEDSRYMMGYEWHGES